jgi:hypothetical protein
MPFSDSSASKNLSAIAVNPLQLAALQHFSAKQAHCHGPPSADELVLSVVRVTALLWHFSATIPFFARHHAFVG